MNPTDGVGIRSLLTWFYSSSAYLPKQNMVFLKALVERSMGVSDYATAAAPTAAVEGGTAHDAATEAHRTAPERTRASELKWSERTLHY